MQLTAGTARPRVGHLPKVVLVAQPIDTVHRHASYFVPELFSFVVRRVDRDIETIGIEAQGLGEILPRILNRIALEVVSEREVPEHLEERVMPGSSPDFLEIVVFASGSYALLRRGGSLELERVLPQKRCLELNHPRIGE